MNLIISQELAQAITTYLADQKYKEVAGFIHEMQQLVPVEVEGNSGATPVGSTVPTNNKEDIK